MSIKRTGKMGMLALLLLLAVAGSVVALGKILGSWVSPDKNVIGLVALKSSENKVKNMRMSGEDGDLLITQTAVSLFEDMYRNEDGSVTVKAENGEHVIAPGTANDYIFQLKNNGNISLDYTMTMSSAFGLDEVRIPVEMRLKNGEGDYIMGSSREWVSPAMLDQVHETGTLEVKQTAQYTLQWRWLFTAEEEPQISDVDAADTALGNLGAEKQIDLSVAINTEAVVTPGTQTAPSGDPAEEWIISDESDEAPESDKKNGSKPKTGDETELIWYLAILAGAVLVIAVSAAGRRREERPDENGRKS